MQLGHPEAGEKVCAAVRGWEHKLWILDIFLNIKTGKNML
jgi:hypothetical protein